MNSRIAGCSYIYPGRSLDAGLALARDFGFPSVDVGIGGLNGHVKPVDAAADPQGWARRVASAAERAGLRLGECFTLNFGPPMNDPDPAVRKHTADRFARLAIFARLAGFSSIMLIPGPVHPDLGRPQSLDLAAEALTGLVKLAAGEGLALHVEADAGSCANTPDAAEELCLRVPGLRLSLDYSHFISLGFTHDQTEKLDRFAGHVHVRQASPGRIVEFADRGAIDLPRLLAHLDSLHFRGRFTVEYLSCTETDDCGVDVMVETPRMIKILDALLSAPAGQP